MVTPIPFLLFSFIFFGRLLKARGNVYVTQTLFSFFKICGSIFQTRGRGILLHDQLVWQASKKEKKVHAAPESSHEKNGPQKRVHKWGPSTKSSTPPPSQEEKNYNKIKSGLYCCWFFVFFTERIWDKNFKVIFWIMSEVICTWVLVEIWYAGKWVVIPLKYSGNMVERIYEDGLKSS